MEQYIKGECGKFCYVCQVDTVYTLFLYLILFPNQIEKTFLFWEWHT